MNFLVTLLTEPGTEIIKLRLSGCFKLFSIAFAVVILHGDATLCQMQTHLLLYNTKKITFEMNNFQHQQQQQQKVQQKFHWIVLKTLAI